MVHRYLMQETELLPPTEPDTPLKLRLDLEEPEFSARSIIWLTKSLLFRISMHCSIRDSGSLISSISHFHHHSPQEHYKLYWEE